MTTATATLDAFFRHSGLASAVHRNKRLPLELISRTPDSYRYAAPDGREAARHSHADCFPREKALKGIEQLRICQRPAIKHHPGRRQRTFIYPLCIVILCISYYALSTGDSAYSILQMVQTKQRRDSESKRDGCQRTRTPPRAMDDVANIDIDVFFRVVDAGFSTASPPASGA